MSDERHTQPKETSTMTTANPYPCLGLDDLVNLDWRIGRAIDATDPATDPEGARLLLRQRRWVRDQIEARKAAASN
jgi:hypothetical protein